MHCHVLRVLAVAAAWPWAQPRERTEEVSRPTLQREAGPPRAAALQVATAPQRARAIRAAANGEGEGAAPEVPSLGKALDAAFWGGLDAALGGAVAIAELAEPLRQSVNAELKNAGVKPEQIAALQAALRREEVDLAAAGVKELDVVARDALKVLAYGATGLDPPEDVLRSLVKAPFAEVVLDEELDQQAREEAVEARRAAEAAAAAEARRQELAESVRDPLVREAVETPAKAAELDPDLARALAVVEELLRDPDSAARLREDPEVRALLAKLQKKMLQQGAPARRASEGWPTPALRRGREELVEGAVSLLTTLVAQIAKESGDAQDTKHGHMAHSPSFTAESLTAIIKESLAGGREHEHKY